MRLRFKVGPLIWEPRYTPDRRPARGRANRADLIVILSLVAFFLTTAIVGTVLGWS